MKKNKFLAAALVLLLLMLTIASCGKKTFVVSFVDNDGSIISTAQVNKGEAVSKPAAPVKTGYEFIGWYTDEGLYDFSTPVTSDISVTAHWGQIVRPTELAGWWRGSETVNEEKLDYVLHVSTQGDITLTITRNGHSVTPDSVRASKARDVLWLSFSYEGERKLSFSVATTLSGTGIMGGELVLQKSGEIAVTYHFANGNSKTVSVGEGEPIPVSDEPSVNDLVLDGWYDALGNLYTGSEIATTDIDLYESAYTEGLNISDGRVLAYTGNASNVIIPPFYSSKAVSEISDKAFADSNIITVQLPFTLKAIGTEAFSNCTGLVSIALDGIETIGERAFYNCTAIASLTIPRSVQSIGLGAFAVDMTVSERNGALTLVPIETNLSELTLQTIVADGAEEAFVAYMFGAPSVDYMNYYEDGKTVTVDGEDKLVNLIYCLPLSLEKINLDLVDTIPDNALYNCFYVVSIEIGSDVKTIGKSAFEGCYSADISGVENIERIGERAFFSTAFTGADMPKLSYIGDYAFANTIISSITLSEDLNYIGESAFAYTQLREIILPESVAYIGDTAFFGCNYLESVRFTSYEPCEIGSTLFTEVDSDGTVYYSRVLIWVPDGDAYLDYRSVVNLRDYAASVFPARYAGMTGYITDGDTLLGYIGESLDILDIPDGISNIADYSFCNRRDIEQVIMPQGFEKIGKYAFYNCTSVANLVFSSTLKEIDDYAFTGFFVGNNLSRLYFPEGFERIGDGAFMSSFNLKIVELPSTLEYVGYLAFGMSNSLERIYFTSENPPEVGTFQNEQEVVCDIFSIVNAGKTVIYVPHGRANGTPIHETYRSAAGFRNFAEYIKVKPEGSEVGHYGDGKLFLDLDGCDTAVISVLAECDNDTSDNGGTRYELVKKEGIYTLNGTTIRITFSDGEEVIGTYSNRTVSMIYGGESVTLYEPRYYYDSYNWTNFKLYGPDSTGYGLFDMYGSFLTPFEWFIVGSKFVIRIDGNNKLPEHSDYFGTVEYVGSYDKAKDSFSVSFMLNDYEQMMSFKCERNNVVYATGEATRFYGTYKCFAESNPDFAMFTFVSYGNGRVDVYIGENAYSGCAYTMKNGVITINFQTIILTFKMDENGFLDGDFLGVDCHFIYVDELLDSTKLPSRDDPVA